MNTYKNKGLKVRLESTHTEKPGGRGVLCYIAPTAERKSPARAAFGVEPTIVAQVAPTVSVGET